MDLCKLIILDCVEDGDFRKGNHYWLHWYIDDNEVCLWMRS